MFDEAIVAARLIMGVPFVIWGIMKLRGGEAQLVPVLAAMGMPDAKALAYLVGLCELLGGVGVILGYPLVLVCIPLAIWCVVTAMVAHKSDLNQMLAHITMSGGFLALAAAGSGSIALFGGDPQGGWAQLP